MSFLEFLEALARLADMKDLTYGPVDFALHTAADSMDDEAGEEEDGHGLPDGWVPPVVMELGAPGQGPLVQRLTLVVEQLLKFLKSIDGTKKKQPPKPDRRGSSVNPEAEKNRKGSVSASRKASVTRKVSVSTMSRTAATTRDRKGPPKGGESPKGGALPST